MRTATHERSVTMALNGAFPFVALEPVLRVPSVMHATTGSTATAFLHCKEMVSATVKGVREPPCCSERQALFS